MIPILFSTITEGTVPTSHGIGHLTDILTTDVHEARNSVYEFSFTYPSNGIHAEEIKVDRYVLAKPNYTDDPQLFKIYEVGGNLAGQIEAKCEHVSYALSGKLITSGTASSCTAACLLLEASAGSFTITTDKNVNADFKIKEPSSVRSWFGGKEGSLLDVYGTGDWYYDNFDAVLKLHRGADRGVQLRYGKNLTELSQIININNLATAIQGYYKAENGTITLGTKISTGLTLNLPQERAIDFSNEVDPESATPIVTQLDNLTNDYIANNQLDTAIKTITLDFIQEGGLTERVDLCDTVHIFFEALGISASLKCIETHWDVINERYTKCVFGNARTDITDTINTVQKEVAEKPSVSEMGKAIDTATKLITGNLGGYAVMHDGDNDGHPDEILIMDTDDITTAVKVWRFNSGGLGYSGTGYAGPYSTIALTNDGKIVADAITTGTLNANLIKAGVISDVAGNSQIDMTTGVAKLFQLIAKRDFTVVDEDGDVIGYLSSSTYGGILSINDASENMRAAIYTDSNGDGALWLYDSNGNPTVKINGGGGHIEQKNGIVELVNGPFYSGTRVPWGPYSAYMIWGQLTSSGSNIAFTVPKTMITTTNQKFIINDEANYSTYLLAYDDVNDELVITWNTASQGAGNQRINKVYGIY